MSEFDELQRLRDADPVRPDAIPSAEDTGPRAARERIVMEELNRSWLRSRAGALTGAAVLAVIAVTGAVLATRGSSEGTPSDAGPVNAGGLGSCVAEYNLDTLQDRDFAFAGTVRSVSGDHFTLHIDEAFKGVSGDEITLQGAEILSGTTSGGGPPVSLEPGTRLLVAGDGNFAWVCGFTQPYDANEAERWRDTLG